MPPGTRGLPRASLPVVALPVVALAVVALAAMAATPAAAPLDLNPQPTYQPGMIGHGEAVEVIVRDQRPSHDTGLTDPAHHRLTAQANLPDLTRAMATDALETRGFVPASPGHSHRRLTLSLAQLHADRPRAGGPLTIRTTVTAQTDTPAPYRGTYHGIGTLVAADATLRPAQIAALDQAIVQQMVALAADPALWQALARR